MRTPLEIRNDALDCLRQADRAQARRHKAILLILAQGWAALAEEMERRSGASHGDEAGEAAPATRSASELHSVEAN